MEHASSKRPKWELADIMRRFVPGYQVSRSLPALHKRLIRHIITCRTAALGGHLEKCDSCPHERPVYNSCRDRHCPKCQTMAKEKWLEERRRELLPVGYFHKVFTLPHELNALILCNKKTMLGILFKAVSRTLLKFGRDPKNRLGGQVGFTLVLHTWNQQLDAHFHLHCVIPGGVLSDDGHWIAAKHQNYLFSVVALSKAFRGAYLSLLQQSFDNNQLIFPKSQGYLEDPIIFKNFTDKLRQIDWVVYSKAPFDGPEKVLNYLGRYTHRVAISNHRIHKVSDTHVSFAYRDRNDVNKPKVATVEGSEFIRRFLLHALPVGLMRIRHYGFLASRNKAASLEKCRRALNALPPKARQPLVGAEQRLLELTGIDVTKCPCCPTGRMHKVLLLHPWHHHPDTS